MVWMDLIRMKEALFFSGQTKLLSIVPLKRSTEESTMRKATCSIQIDFRGFEEVEQKEKFRILPNLSPGASFKLKFDNVNLSP